VLDELRVSSRQKINHLYLQHFGHVARNTMERLIVEGKVERKHPLPEADRQPSGSD